MAKSVPPEVPQTFKGTPEERDLVWCLLHGKLTPADMRRLRPDMFSVPACQTLVELALSHLGRDGRIELRTLLDDAMEDEQCGALATELSLREDHYDDVAEHIKGCLERLDLKRAESVLRDLIAQLKSAEREGRWDDAQTLNVQVNELRKRKAGAPTAGPVSLVKE